MLPKAGDGKREREGESETAVRQPRHDAGLFEDKLKRFPRRAFLVKAKARKKRRKTGNRNLDPGEFWFVLESSWNRPSCFFGSEERRNSHLAFIFEKETKTRTRTRH